MKPTQLIVLTSISALLLLLGGGVVWFMVGRSTPGAPRQETPIATTARVRNAQTETTIDYYVTGRVASYGEETPLGLTLDLVFDDDELKQRLPIILHASDGTYRFEGRLVTKPELTARAALGARVTAKLSFLTSRLTRKDRELMALLRRLGKDFTTLPTLSTANLVADTITAVQ